MRTIVSIVITNEDNIEIVKKERKKQNKTKQSKTKNKINNAQNKESLLTRLFKKRWL